MPTVLGSLLLSDTEMTSLTQTQSFANGQLTGIENDVVHTSNNSNPGAMQIGDTMTLGGVDYTIVGESGGFSDIEYDAGSGPQVAYGNVSQLELSGPGGTTFASLLGGPEGVPLNIPAGAEILGYTPNTVTAGWGNDAWAFDTPWFGHPIGPGSQYEYGADDYAAPPAPCFTPGNMIETPDGLRDVDDLEVGDLVMTKDHGAQPIRWVYKRLLTASWFAKNPDLVPVQIAMGALGHNTPSKDTTISPGHMFMLNATDTDGTQTEVLVPANQLVKSGAAKRLAGAATTYIHIMFDRHEIVRADGAWSESFRPGPMSLNFMGSAARGELLRIFPELAGEGGLETYRPARTPLYRQQAQAAIQTAINTQ